MYKFTGFTEKANTALNIAVETAEDLGHTYIGSEHLLIGLLRDTGGVACVALAGRGVTAAQVEELMRKTIGIGAPTVLSPADFTPRCKRIIELAILEARGLGHNYVGTEHLLIAIIQEGGSFAGFTGRFNPRSGRKPPLRNRIANGGQKSQKQHPHP